jgi:hypothetical protein
MSTTRGGPSQPWITRDVRRRAGTGRAPGSVLIAVAAWLLALIGGGALFVSFSAQYAYIFAVRRQDAASVIEALLLDLLMIVFTLLALGLARAGKSSWAERALILACSAASAYMNVSAADVASPRSVTAYAIAPVALAMVMDAAPLPGLPETPAPEAIEPPRTKKAVLLALYRAHPHYGNRSRASRVAAELAPQAGLQAGTARSYLYAELDGRSS